MKKSKLSIALGSMIVASAVAAQNPFQVAALDKGYMVADNHKAKEGKCGEAKCGANKTKEAKCGGDKAKMKEGACGGDKAPAKAKDGKCGEGKCGGSKK